METTPTPPLLGKEACLRIFRATESIARRVQPIDISDWIKGVVVAKDEGKD